MKTESPPLAPRWLWPLLIIVFLAGIAGGACVLANEFVLRLNHFRWNGSRLAPIQALVDGYRLYYELGEGPVLNTIYGPLSFYPYWPATLFASPTASILAGQIISLLLFFAPLTFLVCLSTRNRLRTSALTLLASFPFFLIAAGQNPGLAYSAVNIHSDAPAVFFMGLSLLVMDRAGPEPALRRLVLSAFFVACSLWAKQIMAPLPLAMALFLLVRSGYRDAIAFFVAVGLWGLLLGLIFTALHGFHAIFFNLFQVPSGHPWIRSYIQSFKFFSDMPLLWFICFCVILHLALELAGDLSGRRSGIRWRHSWILYGLSAAFLTPVGLLGLSKVGGWDNSMTPALYSGVMLVFVLGRLHISEDVSWKGVSRTAGLLAVAVSIYAAIAGFRLGPGEVAENWKEHEDNPNQQAFDFIQNSTLKVYFPMAPFAVLKATGKLYHFDYGLQDLYYGGYELTTEQLRRWIPEDPEYLAFRYPRPLNELFILRYFPYHTVKTRIGALPEWEVYRKAPGAPPGVWPQAPDPETAPRFEPVP